MAATIQIHEMTATSTGVDKTSSTVRFKSADETSVDVANKIKVPTSGTTYSYTKQLRFYVSVAPATNISNLNCYSDGTSGFGTGTGVQYDTSGSFSTNVNTNISGTNFFLSNSGSPIDMDTTNTGPFTGTGYKGDFLRIQLTVADTAGPGMLSAESIVFTYDES
jgi:hypothetical protein